MSKTSGTVVALGSFDGLHMGHMTVLNAAKEAAKRLDAEPVICTFKEHPLKVLNGEAPPALFTGEIMEELFASTGMDLYRLDFAEIKDYAPEAFFQKILMEELKVKGVCCGFNFSFGAKGAGTPELMRRFCKEAGVEFHELPAKRYADCTVSSTVIRSLLQEGRVGFANELLGRPFRFREPVIAGDGRGHTWGIPTINQMYPKELVVPKFGVYRSRVSVDGNTYAGATNIGVRPTVRDGESVSAETFVIGFTGDLYGKTVDLELLDFIRPEKRFSSFSELEAQIRADIATISEGII